MEFRLLTREEAATVPGMIDPMPDSLFVVGAVDERGVLAAGGMFLALCGDPLWLREDHRHSGKTLLRLWEAMQAEILKRGGNGLRVTMTETCPGPPLESVVAKLCRYAGGEEVPARLFLVPVEA